MQAYKPLDAPCCPLCSEPNHCAVTAAASYDVECWCTKINVPRELIETLPRDAVNRACICKRCIEKAAVLCVAKT